MEFVVLTGLWLGKPIWMWLAFAALVLALLAFDLFFLNKGDREIGVRRSLLLSLMYIGIGLAFGGWVWLRLGADAGLSYLTGFVVEKTLALDNVFVIALVFSFFAVPARYQHRVLFWGIVGVVVLRAIMIGLGATLVARFDWLLYVFAVFLVLAGVKMLFLPEKQPDLAANPVVRLLRRWFSVTDEHHGEAFLVRKPDAAGRVKWFATPLLMALVMIEIADVIFAVDSVPAIFAITTDPFVVYTSNIFAVLGLRALYFALAAMLGRFRYLKPALALVLVFIGAKIFVADLLGLPKFPPALSLAITLAIIGAGVVWSLVKTRESAEAAQGKPAA